MEPQKTQNCQSNPEEKREKHNPTRQYYKATVIKTVWCWWEKKQKPDIWSSGQNKEPRNKPHTYSQLTFDKGGNNTHGEKTISSARDVGKTGQPYVNQWC